MTRMAMVALGAALLLGACGGSDPESFSSVDGLATALQDSDVGCTDLEVADPPTDEDADESLPREAGVCDSGDRGLQLFVFADAEARDKWLTLGSRFSGDVVTGPNWTVIAPDEDTADEIADALGGET